MNKKKIPMGQLLITAKAARTFPWSFISSCIERHSTGDWGDLSDADKSSNDEAVVAGMQIISAYNFRKDRIWVITEWDRNSTTVLLPEEY